MSKPALVLGNGPSVDRVSAALLERFETYGTNHIYKKFSLWGRPVDNVVITDSNRVGEIGNAYANFKGRLYVGDQRYIDPPVGRIRRILGRDFVPLRQLPKRTMPVNAITRRIRWTHYLFTTVFDKTRFTFNFEQGLNFGYSVVISAIQIAAIQGHKLICLCGVDSKYNTPKDYFAGAAQGISYVNEAFTSNPRTYMEPLLVLLQIYFEPMGVELLDCSEGGALRFIRKSTLEEVAGSAAATGSESLSRS